MAILNFSDVLKKVFFFLFLVKLIRHALYDIGCRISFMNYF